MKREFLENLDLGNGVKLSKEAIDAIMAENGKDIEAEKAKTTSKIGELEKANQTIRDLQETIKKYDGKDPAKLEADLAALQKKYDEDVAAERSKADKLQKEYRLKDALKAAGAVDPDYLIFKHGGVEKFAFDNDGKPVGIDDITKPYRESSPHLFTDGKPATSVKTGMRQTGKETVNDKKDEANAAFRSLFGKES